MGPKNTEVSVLLSPYLEVPTKLSTWAEFVGRNKQSIFVLCVCSVFPVPHEYPVFMEAIGHWISWNCLQIL